MSPHAFRTPRNRERRGAMGAALSPPFGVRSPLQAPASGHSNAPFLPSSRAESGDAKLSGGGWRKLQACARRGAVTFGHQFPQRALRWADPGSPRKAEAAAAAAAGAAEERRKHRPRRPPSSRRSPPSSSLCRHRRQLPSSPARRLARLSSCLTLLRSPPPPRAPALHPTLRRPPSVRARTELLQKRAERQRRATQPSCTLTLWPSCAPPNLRLRAPGVASGQPTAR